MKKISISDSVLLYIEDIAIYFTKKNMLWHFQECVATRKSEKEIYIGLFAGKYN